ncbi:alkaline phosphatase family protein [Stieleria sp. ICT_E10.1]|uniref:alkaline phosphatase D family protein n=1 Tax=Stieleria sedimenti TaxID=2976331 RepID=UPI00218094D2|nr:alkaline phosphatase D family protein [Stieleria sedimenti]MCS7465839.1 alkaline phosphatase family protein [Stieleria sedimenti]
MFKTLALASLISIVLSPLSVSADADSSALVTRVVFGSCIKQDQPAPIFSAMAAERAQLLLFTGDNIYADTEDMAVMRNKYQALSQKPGFASLIDSAPVMATWDDHDFGVNDGGADYPKRAESQREFLDFWNVPADSPLRQRPGVYDSKSFGPEGKRLQVILLDTRFFRSPLKKGERRVGGPYEPDDDAEKSMLGDAQWRWLGEQLRQPADVRLIVSSIQFVAQDAGQECWANLPLERDRMLNLIRDTRADRVVFISGDRHWSEVSALVEKTPYPIYDITCSSLNQLHKRGTPTDNRYRVSESTYHRENYGLLTIGWQGDDPTLTFQIRDLERNPVIEQTLTLSDLRGR